MEVPGRLERGLRLVSFLDRTLGSSRIQERPLIVGGAAVEWYTLGGYASQDMNLVTTNHEPLLDLLREAGFQHAGGHWWRPGLDIALTIHGETLTDAPASYGRVIEIEVPGALRTCIIGIEDILLSRLCTGIENNRRNDLGWASQMVLLHNDRIDWNVLESLACGRSALVLAEVKRLGNPRA